MDKDNIISEADTRFGRLAVEQTARGYTISVDGVVKHPDCSNDAVIRALCHYIHGAEYSLMKFENKD